MTANLYNQYINQAKPILCSLIIKESDDSAGEQSRDRAFRRLMACDADVVSTVHVIMELGRAKLFSKGRGPQITRPEINFCKMQKCVGWCSEETKQDFVCAIMETSEYKKYILAGMSYLQLIPTEGNTIPPYNWLIERVKPALTLLLREEIRDSEQNENGIPDWFKNSDEFAVLYPANATGEQRIKAILNACDIHILNTIAVIYYAGRMLDTAQKHILREKYFYEIVDIIGWKSNWSRYDRILFLSSKDNLCSELRKGMQQLDITISA